MQNIANKVVIITGASSGIGEATALKLAAEGAKLVLGARREDKLKAIAAHIKPLLTRGLLFGALAHGGTATVDAGDEGLVLRENSTPKNADYAADEV